MSMDSDTSSHSGADHRSFRQITRDRLLIEMLRSTRKSSRSTWKVLIMDKLTVKIMSFSCKMADITEEGVSLVEDLYKRRQPLPSMDAIYFMQPAKENIRIFLSDMSGKNPLYKKAYVFFSSPVQRELVAHIKKDSTVLTRIGALSEMNLEYFAIDSQGFITDHDKALEELFNEAAEGSHKYNACLTTMAIRIATVFASMRIAGKLNNIIKEHHLKDVGQLEQDLAFGDAGTKELINFLRTCLEVSRENKLRLLMIYAAINPEKFESEKGAKLMQLAGLSADDMIAVNNMRCLCGPDTKKPSPGGFTLKFDLHKKKHGIRKDRVGEESTWMLSRFYPILEDLIVKLSKGELPKDEYHCMNDPSPSFCGIPGSMSARTSPAHLPAQSMRSRRIDGTWARPRNSDDGYSSDSVLKHASSDLRKLGQRLFVFVIGGATRSELRAAHKLTGKLKREIILGSSSLDDPPQFITKLKMLSTEELSLDDLQI